MSIVTLVSGGLDSTLVAAMCLEEGLTQHPLFINYGQRSAARELSACRVSLHQLGINELFVADISAFGTIAPSGLTDARMDVFEDAFTPGRNLLFLSVAAAYAATKSANSVAIGLLDEKYSIFPDQTSSFLSAAEATLSIALGREIQVLAPLSGCSKADVVAMAEARGLVSTYSCHAGGPDACGRCVACREFKYA